MSTIMKADKKNAFITHLREKYKYPAKCLRDNIYKYDCQEYCRVEVLYGDYIIQAFVLMDDELCSNQDKFPFYRAYNQRNDYGFLTPPACYVAVKDSKTNDWAIHNSSDLKQEMTSPTLLDYSSAVERFKNRLQYLGNRKLAKRVVVASICALVFIVLYYAAHVLSINGILISILIPFDSHVFSLLTLIAILLILPPLVPYIKIQYHGLSLEVNQD